MSRVFTATRHIDAPPERVWEVLVDVARWPEWTPTMTSVERLDTGPFQVGSRAKVRQPKLPQLTWVVSDIVDGRSFTWAARSPGVTTTGRHEVVPDGSGSRVTLSIEQTGPLAPVAALVWGRLTQGFVDTEGECLAKRVEPTPA